MYAIVEIAGKQYKVRENDKLVVPQLSGDVDDSVTFDRVLLVANDDDVHVGTPVVPDASVTATILEHVKGDKVLVFRKKRRKRFKVKRGHRQPYTRIEVSGLSVDGATAKKASKKAPKTEGEEVASEAAAATAEAGPEQAPVAKAGPAPEAKAGPALVADVDDGAPAEATEVDAPSSEAAEPNAEK